MRHVKVMREIQGEIISDSYPCTHYSVRETPVDSPAARLGLSPAGITLELGPPTRKSFYIPVDPVDGEIVVAYIENEDGKTVAKYPKGYKPPVKESEKGPEKAEFRVTEEPVKVEKES